MIYVWIDTLSIIAKRYCIRGDLSGQLKEKLRYESQAAGLFPIWFLTRLSNLDPIPAVSSPHHST
jgi:hypothetical protein